jgi:hypothetical protein
VFFPGLPTIKWGDPLTRNLAQVILPAFVNPNISATTSKTRELISRWDGHTTANVSTLRAAGMPFQDPIMGVLFGSADAGGSNTKLEFLSSSGAAPGTSNTGLITTSKGDFTGDFTCLVVANPASDGTNYNILFTQNSNAVTNNFEMWANANSSAANAAGVMTAFTYNGTNIHAAQSVASQVDGLYHVWMFRRLGGTNSIWRDGVNITSSGATSDTIAIGVTSTTGLCIGGRAGQNLNPKGANCTITQEYGWNRALSDVEMAILGRDPSRIFVRPRPVWMLNPQPTGAAAASSFVVVPPVGVFCGGF